MSFAKSFDLLFASLLCYPVVVSLKLRVTWNLLLLSTYAVQLTVGSRPSDRYFRSVCWFVCLCLSVCLSVGLFVCAEFFSAVFDPISIKLGHMLYVWV